MLKIVNGSFDKLKQEMKQFFNANSLAIKNLKKMIKEINKDDPQKTQMSLKYQKDIEKLEFYTKKMHNPSKVLPVRVGGIVINYKAYQSFVKKIVKFERKASFSENCLIVEYKAGPHSKGKIEFTDLSFYFQDFAHIPDAELLDDEES